MRIDGTRLQAVLDAQTARLLAERSPAGHWIGELSSSALSTATATVALTLAAREGAATLPRARGGAAWLGRTQNPDGGWGDTTRSVSNISTTALCWAALSLDEIAEPQTDAARERARAWIRGCAGDLGPEALANTIAARYGRDRTFSVPILTVLALARLLGDDRAGWRRVPQLPFELAAVPRAWYRWLRLPVVSYALPALIAIGQARHAHAPSRNPVARALRRASIASTLRTLDEIQPTSGGFLEATPLTSFVVMSLIAAGRHAHVVVRRGLEFLERSVRPDGSWPIDTNLATWVTTLGVTALACRSDWPAPLGEAERAALRRWLLDQQYRVRHPYTGAEAGGWAWTELPGGVPDADDTPGALLALHALGRPDAELCRAAGAGIGWLVGLQNADGGMPTFCRGWGTLPFDRSSPDLTAHALRAWTTWRPLLPTSTHATIDRAVGRAVRYLARAQRADGAWRPLWFGNQHAPDDANLTYGTARVVKGLVGVPSERSAADAVARGVHWLLEAEHPDGGWGGVAGVPCSVEESALALTALATWRARRAPDDADVNRAIERGTTWLMEALEQGLADRPTPIGFYFAKLWYFERLYPTIFAVEALASVRACLDGHQ